jgi:hypothetical protein
VTDPDIAPTDQMESLDRRESAGSVERPAPTWTDAGLWEGARYLDTGIYRQGYGCIMRYLGAPFCDVAAEQYPLRLYSGGWGVPGAGIDNIEPGSESPTPGSLSAPTRAAPTARRCSDRRSVRT